MLTEATTLEANHILERSGELLQGEDILDRAVLHDLDLTHERACREIDLRRTLCLSFVGLRSDADTTLDPTIDAQPALGSGELDLELLDICIVGQGLLAPLYEEGHPISP